MIQEYDPEDSPYSFGTTPIYNSLFKLLTNDQNDIDIVMINISAIVRNVSGKTNMQNEYKDAKARHFPFDVLAGDIVKETEKEVKLLVSDIVQMFNSGKNALSKYIFVYMSDIKRIIPTQYVKKTAPGKIHLDMAEDRVRAEYTESRTLNVINGINVIEIYNYSKIAPFRIIAKEIKDIKNNHNVAMISNHPIDYHILDYCNKWCNIKSYTGEFQYKQDLGKKVFGYECLPFTTRMHVYFGDTHDIKPAAEAKVRKEIIEHAEKDNWNLKTTEYVDKVCSRLGYLEAYSI